MKIDHHIVSIPPYISTSWDHVRSLSVKDSILLISLYDDEVIRIPGLSEQQIANIFKMHAEWLEREQEEDTVTKAMLAQGPEFNFGTLVSDDGQTSFSILMNGMTEMEAIPGLGIALQHNPSQAKSPNLPREVLGRIGSIGKMMIPEGAEGIPEAEPHCNCYYCQIARTIHSNVMETLPLQALPEEHEKVNDDDLTFCQWNIHPLGEHIFEVTNRLDTLESYKVCLEPHVGCTCGREGCEHLVAVLKS